MRLFRRPQAAVELDEHLDRPRNLFEPCDRRLEVAGIGEAVGADRAAVGKLEVLAVDFQNVAVGVASLEMRAEADAPLNYGDFMRRNRKAAELGDQSQRATLRHDQ